MIGISEFFAGETVFITGTTGFLGKALLEKILRSCPDVDRVYLLIRSKGLETAEERLHKLVRSDKVDYVNPLQPNENTLPFKTI